MGREIDQPPTFDDSRFDPPDEVTDSYGDPIERTFDGRSDEGISGLWFPDHGTMVVDPRGVTHHNQQWHAVTKAVFDTPMPSPVMPWAANYTSRYEDGEYTGETLCHLELPSTAGGLTQAMFRSGAENHVERWTHGHQVDESVLWPVVYACRLLDLQENTLVRFDHSSTRSVEPTYSERRVFLLADAYREMRFDDALPEPVVHRPEPVVPPKNRR